MVFRSRHRLEGSLDVTIGSCTEPCIRCGAQAETSPGVFNVFEEAVEVISAPEATINHLRQLGLLASDLLAGKISEEEAVAEAEKISPQAGAAFKKWIANNVVGIAALLAAGAMYYDQKSGARGQAVQMERLIDAVQRSQIAVSDQPRNERASEKPQGENRKARRAEQARQRRAKEIRH